MINRKKHILLTILLIFTLVVTACFPGGDNHILEAVPSQKYESYENKLFDKTRVHKIDIQINDWQTFLDNAPKEIYYKCENKYW